MKIFMVTSGSYSNYNVLGVYSIRELAERAKKILRGDTIDELEVDAVIDCPVGMLPYRVYMDIEGNSVVRRIDMEAMRLNGGALWRQVGDNKRISFTMFASDEQHAVKIANERRTYLKANALWIASYSL